MDTLFLVCFAVLLLFAVLFCLARGFKRSLVRLIAVIACAVLALPLAKPIGGAVLQAIGLNELQLPEAVEQLIRSNAVLQGIATNLPKMAAAPVVYPVIFAVLCLLANIPVAILNRKKEKTQKGKGALIGVAVGVLSFLIAFGPLMSTASLAVSALNLLPEEARADILPDEPVDLGIVTVNPTAALENSTMTSAVGQIGQPLLDTLTSAKIGSSTVSLSKEIENVLPLLDVVVALEGDVNELNVETITEKLPVLIEKAEKSEALQGVLDVTVEALASEYITEADLQDEDIMEAVAQTVNQINRGEGDELLAQIEEVLAEENIPIPKEVITYAKEYIGRAFAGTDWTPEQMQKALEELLKKY